MSSPRVVELERQLDMIEKAVDAAAGDRVTEVWLAISVCSRNRPGRDLWLKWLSEAGLICNDLKLLLHRLPPLATSNSPTFGRANSPGQDGLIINHQCLRAQGVRPLP